MIKKTIVSKKICRVSRAVNIEMNFAQCIKILLIYRWLRIPFEYSSKIVSYSCCIWCVLKALLTPLRRQFAKNKSVENDRSRGSVFAGTARKRSVAIVVDGSRHIKDLFCRRKI